jgi:uncharacterized tellurite resistance protein B-like protein
VAIEFDLLLGRALIAAAWADGELGPEEREALEDLLLALDDISADTWRALHADFDRPFGAEHRERLFAELEDALEDEENRARTRSVVSGLLRRLPPDTPEAKLLDELRRSAATVTHGEPVPTAGNFFSRLGGALANGLGREVGQIRRRRDEGDDWEASLRTRLAHFWPADEEMPDDETLHRLCTGAAILAHVVRLDDVVDDGEREALHEALSRHWGLGPAAARLATELVLDETAGGLDLHVLLREFQRITPEEERKRFLAAVMQVAAGDGSATYDEIEEVRRIGRGLLLSHEHFIAAKLAVPGDHRET